jgi:peptidoglycan/LPS O-acetylase OafA/YrhL
MTGPGLFRLVLSLLVFADHVSRYNFGTTAVFLFFILSGFWITMMWEGKYSLLSHPYWTFLISRFWRIYPVFAMAGLLAVFTSVVSGRYQPVKGPLLAIILENIQMIGAKNISFAANPPAWSLDIEAQFYLIAPMMLGLIKKSLWWISAIALLCLISLKLCDDFSVLPYILFFTAGSVCAVVKWNPSWRLSLTALLLAIIIALVCAGTGILEGGRHPTQLYLSLVGPASGFIAFVALPFAIFTTRHEGGASDRMMGDLSFIVYMIHRPILDLIRTGDGGVLHRASSACLALGLTLVTSFLIWKILDRPLNKARAAWVAKRPSIIKFDDKQ